MILLCQYVFGYVFLPLSEVSNTFRGEYITKKSTHEGEIPVILGGQEPAYYIDKANHDGEIVVVARSVVPEFPMLAEKLLEKLKFLYLQLKNRNALFLFSTASMLFATT
mgnify:CR=1 FL=1